MATLSTCTSTTRPGSPSAGDMLYETDTSRAILYTGSAWKVFAPSDSAYPIDGTSIISKRPNFHFDAENFNGFDTSGNPSDGTKIDTSTVWKCRATGGDIEGSQAASADEPTYKTGGTNSKPYVKFANTEHIELSKLTSLSGPFTVFGIAQTTSSYDLCLVGDGAGGGNVPIYNIHFNWTAGAEYLYFGRTGADNGAPALDYYTALRAILVIRDSSNNTRVYVDGNNTNSAVVGTNTQTQWVSALGMGTSPYNHDGDIYEVALWDSDLSTADRNLLGDYAQAKYGSSNLGWTDFT